jgi:hypothetical protein
MFENFLVCEERPRRTYSISGISSSNVHIRELDKNELDCRVAVMEDGRRSRFGGRPRGQALPSTRLTEGSREAAERK